MLTNPKKCDMLNLDNYIFQSRRTEMIVEIACPLCNGGKLKINISNGYEVVTSGALSQLPCVCVCKNCNRKVKYNVVKSEQK